MACYYIYAKDKTDFMKIQLTAFALGFCWLTLDQKLDTKFRNYIYLYTSSKLKHMTKSNKEKDYGGLTNEFATRIPIEKFLRYNPNDF